MIYLVALWAQTCLKWTSAWRCFSAHERGLCWAHLCLTFASLNIFIDANYLSSAYAIMILPCPLSPIFKHCSAASANRYETLFIIFITSSKVMYFALLLLSFILHLQYRYIIYNMEYKVQIGLRYYFTEGLLCAFGHLISIAVLNRFHWFVVPSIFAIWLTCITQLIMASIRLIIARCLASYSIALCRERKLGTHCTSD